MNIASVFRLLAAITLFVAALMLIPLSIAMSYKETSAEFSFLVTILLMAIISCAILAITHKRHRNIKINARDSYLFVTITWLALAFFGAIPLYLTRTINSFTGCYFEIMSGLTTTGATCMDMIERADKSILFWRNMTNWLGGMGIVVLFVAVLPAFGVKGASLVGAESVGPTKDKLTPQIQHTALALWAIYLSLSLIEVIFLLLGRLSLFDAVTVTFGTMGAAGFAPKDASIAAFTSPYVEWVCIIFMFIAGANFGLYFKAISGERRKLLKDIELRIYTCIIVVASLITALNLILTKTTTISQGIRDAFFQVVSFITTTGFTSANYSTWPIFSQAILFLLCFVGGCAGSAGGGIKVIRVATLVRLGGNSIKKRLHPSAITNIKLGDDTVEEETILSISGFVGLYLVTVLVATVLLSATNLPFDVCLSSVLLSIGNIGIGFGGIGTDFTFSAFPAWSKWLLSFLMLAGRLELFTVYALFTRTFWRNAFNK